MKVAGSVGSRVRLAFDARSGVQTVRQEVVDREGLEPDGKPEPLESTKSAELAGR